MTTMIEVTPRASAMFRLPCFICGGYTDRDDVQPSFPHPFDSERRCYVCRDCIAAGSGAIKQRLFAFAESLEGFASQLRDIARGYKFALPTADDIERVRSEIYGRDAEELLKGRV